MKAGDRWVSTSNPSRGFTVLEVSRNEIVVEVDRVVPNKDGKPKTERRKRSVARSGWQHFTLAYEVAN